MPLITRIIEQKRRPNRRNVHLDGRFGFGCHVNVVARFRLREGLNLTPQQVREIEQGELRQECFDQAMACLGRRLHSRSELQRKLARREHGSAIIASVLDELTRLGYIDDERFARTKALSAADHKRQGRRRAMVELLRSGVNTDVARRALEEVYGSKDTAAIARALAEKHSARLRSLDPLVARRRLAGMLQRRGFGFEEIRPVLDEVLPAARDA